MLFGFKCGDAGVTHVLALAYIQQHTCIYVYTTEHILNMKDVHLYGYVRTALTPASPAVAPVGVSMSNVNCCVFEDCST